VTFFGCICNLNFSLVRKRTQKRALRKINEKILLYKRDEISEDKVHATLMSYLGVLSHADAHRFSEKLKNDYFFNVGNTD
jgi:hypothetical protein